jgi:S1-C subfamily serine protease
MNTRKLNRIWLAALALVLASVACVGGGETPQPVTPIPNNPTPTTGRNTLIASTVQIYGLFNKNGQLVPGYVGSGTIISQDGLILTNAHVADPAAVGDPEYHPDALAVGLVQSEDKPAVFSYRAQVVAIDGYLDLAVIRIVSGLDGSSINPADLRLPFVPLGDSDQVHVGDHVNIYGFPAIGGETITYTDGNVSGFTAEAQVGDRAWIKTDATISGGNSGGLAANDAGAIIGVPTQASSGAGGDITDCRVIQDTNGDGVLDERDTCIPIGGFINALRPINLARPLINAAQTGMAYTSPFGQIGGNTPGGGSETFGPVTWYQADVNCTKGNQVNSFPTGISAMTAVFSFSNMTDGQAWGSIWTANGQQIYTSNDAWDSGNSGTYSFCLFNSKNPIPDGNYAVQFFVGAEQRVLTQGSVVVGSGTTPPPTQPPSTSGISLYGTVTDSSTGRPVADAYVFVLMSGVNYDSWAAANYPDSQILMMTKTDANGNYRMPLTFPRNMPFTIVISARGYYDKYGDNLVWSDSDPSDYRIDAQLNK